MSLHQADIDETEATPLFERRFAADKRTLVIACGALAREILSLRDGLERLEGSEVGVCCCF